MSTESTERPLQGPQSDANGSAVHLGPPESEIELDGIAYRRDEVGMWQATHGFYPGGLMSDALDEIERLRKWQNDATIVLAAWDETWQTAGCPGPLGSSKAEAVANEIQRLRDAIADLLHTWDTNWADSPEVAFSVIQLRRLTAKEPA